MFLPRPQPDGAAGRRPIAACGFFLALFIGLGSFVVSPARAADGDVFSVSAVEVDVTAASSADARGAALAEGQRRALMAVYERLVVAEDIEFLPVDDDTVAELIAGFEIGDEKVSPTRYRARMAVAFNPQAMRLHLRRHRARFAESRSDGVIVVPVLIDGVHARLWAEPNPWRDAWAARPEDTSLLPVFAPLGDIEDFTIVNDASVLQAPIDVMRHFASRYQLGSLVVAIAQMPAVGEPDAPDMPADEVAAAVAAELAAETGEASLAAGGDAAAAVLGEEGEAAHEAAEFVTGTMPVTLRHVGPGGEESTQVVVTPAEREQLGAFLGRAVEEVVATLRERWKTTNLLRFDQENVLQAMVPLDDGLASWLDIRGRLRALPVIVGVELAELSRAAAVVRLTHLGDLEQLSFALDGERLELVIDEGGWLVQPKGRTDETP